MVCFLLGMSTPSVSRHTLAQPMLRLNDAFQRIAMRIQGARSAGKTNSRRQGWCLGMLRWGAMSPCIGACASGVVHKSVSRQLSRCWSHKSCHRAVREADADDALGAGRT